MCSSFFYVYFFPNRFMGSVGKTFKWIMPIDICDHYSAILRYILINWVVRSLLGLTIIGLSIMVCPRWCSLVGPTLYPLVGKLLFLKRSLNFLNVSQKGGRNKCLVVLISISQLLEKRLSCSLRIFWLGLEAMQNFVLCSRSKILKCFKGPNPNNLRKEITIHIFSCLR